MNIIDFKENKQYYTLATAKSGLKTAVLVSKKNFDPTSGAALADTEEEVDTNFIANQSAYFQSRIDWYTARKAEMDEFLAEAQKAGVEADKVNISPGPPSAPGE